MIRSRWWVIVLAVVFFGILPLGCGGSSSGTGSKTYAGTVETRDGEPQSGVLVTIIETGQQALTDALGQFVFESVAAQGEITLMFAGALINDELSLAVPEDGNSVTVNVTADEETGEIVDSSVIVESTSEGDSSDDSPNSESTSTGSSNSSIESGAGSSESSKSSSSAASSNEMSSDGVSSAESNSSATSVSSADLSSDSDGSESLGDQSSAQSSNAPNGADI